MPVGTQGSAPFSLAGIELFPFPNPASGLGGFEVPEDLEIQMSAWCSVHRFPSGPGQPSRKSTQTFGTFVDPITWQAEFIGPGAEQKARAIAAVHAARALTTFQYATFVFTVLVTKFKLTFHTQFAIGYEIALEVQQDNSGLLTANPGAITAQQQLASQYEDLMQTQPPGPIPPNDSLSTPVQILQQQVTSTGNAIQTVQPETAASLPALLKVAGLLGQTILQAQALQGLAQGRSDATGISVYLWATSIVAELASYAATLSTITGADGSNQSTYGATDLFTIAATELGDPMRAFDIAALNGLVDMYLESPLLLNIPPLRQSAPASY